MNISEDVFYYNIISYLQPKEVNNVILAGNKKWTTYLKKELQNNGIIRMFDPALRELINLAPEYDIDKPTSSKSLVIGRNFGNHSNSSKSYIPYIHMTIYLADDHEQNIYKMTIRDYIKEKIILFNGGDYIASRNVESYIHLSDYYGIGMIANTGMNQLKYLVKNGVIDIKDTMNQGYMTRIKYL